MTIVAWGGVGKTSLVAEWMARKAADGWTGFERVFDWSFYSQGTREQGAASADPFIAQALRFFGDPEMAASNASPWDKGARLARLVAGRRTLLVLDGVEPLQHPPGPMAGQLKDPALATVLKGLAQRNPGLCVVTTRERVTDLARFNDTTAPEIELQRLSILAGVELLKSLGVRGTEAEFRKLVGDVEGHALTLNLLGRYLARAHSGDIRKREQVRIEKADAKIQGGHAFNAIAAYEKWLAEGGEDGARQLAVLRVLGLFDRPADRECLEALRREPVIPSLTEPLVGLAEEDWNLTISALADLRLASSPQAGADDPQSPIRNPQSLDAHPLVREYFAKRLCEENPEAWRSAHRRLYEHLAERAEYRPDTFEGILPLYQAVAHGCQAGLTQEARAKVYGDRIKRGNEYYSANKLGAIGPDLGAVACFFERRWTRFLPGLDESDQAWLLGEAGFSLRALGRLTEALEPMRAGLNMRVKQENWTNASISASNLSELVLTLGDVEAAVREAEQSVSFADRSGVASQQFTKRTTLADALHQRGSRADALARFREAETMQAEWQPLYSRLYSLPGFWYCDLLLAEPERAAWRTLEYGDLSPLSELQTGRSRAARLVAAKNQSGDESPHSKACREVERRAAQTLMWVTAQNWLLDIALDHLTLGRTALYRMILQSPRASRQSSSSTEPQDPFRDGASSLETVRENLTAAVNGLRRAGTQHYLPRGLLSHAWLRFLEGDPDGAREDLDAAWEIAERGPMRLFMADVHLHRARLFRDKAELKLARALIEQCGYWRRKEELEDAEEAATHWA